MQGVRLSGATPPPDPSCVFTTVRVTRSLALWWPQHRRRLADSAQEVLGARLTGDLDDRVAAAAESLAEGRLWVHVDDQGTSLQSGLPAPSPTPRSLVTVTGRTGSWRHKWCDRRQVAEAEQLVGADRVPVFAADDGRLLETATANLLVVDGTTLLTPPLSDDLLPGVTREVVLAAAASLGLAVEERDLRAGDVLGRPALTTSSLVGVVPVARLDGQALPQDDGLVQRLRAATAP